MKKFIFSLFLSFPIFLAINVSANANVICQPIYGGGETCIQIGNVFIDKTVQNPHSSSFVDNLEVNDPKYTPSSSVSFRISVTNKGGSAISKVIVKDIFPQFVNFVSGPGNFDANTKTLSFDVNNLKTGESRTFTLQGKIASSDQFPSSQEIICVVNQAMATSDDGQQSSDNTQFCIEKPVLGVTKGGLKVAPAPSITTMPATGPEMLSLLGLIPTGFLGFILRKKSFKKTAIVGGEK